MIPTHSPLPWQRNIPPASKYPTIFSGRNTHVLRVVTSGLSDEEIEANMRLVITAVNCHPGLLAAAKFALECATVPVSFALQKTMAEECIAMLTAAIDAAEK